MQEDKLDTSLTENYSDVKLLITKTLHEIQPWFHGPLSRIEAERSIEDSGHKDGKF
ncbi:tyrosine-protein kinase, partial [Nephila pilipes]